VSETYIRRKTVAQDLNSIEEEF